MTEFDQRRTFGPPIAAQILALLICGVAVGQVITLLIVFLTPPPRPSVYQLSEIAAALGGQVVSPSYGRPLLRHIGEPPPPVEAPERERPGALALAALLGVTPDRVRLRVEPMSGPFGEPGRGNRPPGPAPFLSRPPPAKPDWPGEPPFFRLGDPEGPIFGDFTAALRQSSGQWMVVAPAAEPYPTAWQSRLILWFLACMVVLAPAGYLFARRLVAPIGAFARAADRLGRDPGAPQLELRGPAEIGVAAQAFNEMQARLRRYIADRTSMIGAVAHDLRTPLARMRFKIEAAKEDLRASLASDIGQMEAMISGVLAFVRDAHHAADRVEVDVLSVLECAVDEARAAGADVELSYASRPTVDGDALALLRLFTNLIDNAVKYGDRARVHLREDEEAVLVEVTDDGPGLPSRELERVFEPFYRGEPSRSRETGGIGLGLAVARSTARAHGGDVRLRSNLAGLTAIVQLPIARASSARR